MTSLSADSGQWISTAIALMAPPFGLVCPWPPATRHCWWLHPPHPSARGHSPPLWSTACGTTCAQLPKLLYVMRLSASAAWLCCIQPLCAQPSRVMSSLCPVFINIKPISFNKRIKNSVTARYKNYVTTRLKNARCSHRHARLGSRHSSPRSALVSKPVPGHVITVTLIITTRLKSTRCSHRQTRSGSRHSSSLSSALTGKPTRGHAIAVPLTVTTRFEHARCSHR